MAEPTTSTADQSRPPALPSTADAVPYVPVSWMAVGAAIVAALFLLVLLVSGYSAYKSRRPMINAPELLFSLAAVAVLLSFAAKRMIRDSDGTRTGQLFNINLPVVSWWVGLVGFLGYGAYFLGIEYSIQREAKAEVLKWVGFIDKGELNRAFHRTLEPGRRGGINPDDAKKLEAEFKEPLVAFMNSDLVRIAQRNKDYKHEFVPGGLRDWMYKDTGIECVYSGTFVCPEGRFPVRIPLKGFESITGTSSEGVGRQWQVVPSQNGFIQREEVLLTTYGWMVLSLEAQGAERGNEFLSAIGIAPVVRPYVYHDLALRDDLAGAWFSGSTQMSGRMASAGGMVLALPYTPEYQKSIAGFARLPNGNELPPDKLAKFLAAWNEGRGITASGSAIRASGDTSSTLTLTEKAVQIRIPVEIPEQNMSASRGRLVVECTDPAVLADLTRLRDTADPNSASRDVPPDLRNRTYAWRIARLETDMIPIQPREAPGPGGPGGPRQ